MAQLADALVLAVLVAVAASCGGVAERAAGSGAGTTDTRHGTGAVTSRGSVAFNDREVGLAGSYPAAWFYRRGVTNLLVPREVLTAATYPLEGGSKAGECAPDQARAGMSAGGAFVWLLEYRPPQGDVWADMSHDRFPPRPPRFRIRRSDLTDGVSCFPGPGYATTFRAADRPFQLLVAFGGRPTDERLSEVEAILNSLAFDALPAPPPDPYAGWPLVNDNPGDSLRPPPNWPATAAMFPTGTTARPRALFFASDEPLAGLPARLVQYVNELPGPFPAEALAAFPADGVLVWVLEEEKGGPSSTFPQIDRDWPGRDGFDNAVAPANAATELTWLRAGGSFRGYRFSVWIAAGPNATDSDLELARKSAASLAVSGCGRDGVPDCPDD